MKKVGTSSGVRHSINQNQFRIKKHFGQNFLIDHNILNQIIMKSEISKVTNVIEVGPGMGALTQALLEHANHVVAYEIDRDLIPILKQNLKEYKNVTLVNSDILKVNIDQEIKEHYPEDYSVVVISNLPYNITTPILMKFLETSKRIKKMIFMVQLEVAKRITSVPDKKDYNALSIAIQYRANAKILFKVPRSVFIPEPNVDSAVIEVQIMDSILHPATHEEFFFQFVHQCFSQRRKTLINNIHHHYPELSKHKLEELFREENIPPQIRSETLSVDDFVKLSDIIFPLVH